MLKLFNSLTGKKEAVKPPARGFYKLFVCGPTVYDFSHIGHARSYLFYDILVRYMRLKGFKIFYLQNITNIDDKIIARSLEERRDPAELAQMFEDEYRRDMERLGVETVTKYAPATGYLPEIYSQIERLIAKKYAYATERGIYFEVRKFKDYGKLSRQNLQQVRPGWRIEPDPQKRDTLDFALWKLADPATVRDLGVKRTNDMKFTSQSEPVWWSPWGWGRPGWHIEDTAIAEKVFGLTYDMHGGGMDLKFPHHESEIAQARGLSGKKAFVKLWVHTGFLTINGEKMSKSLKNFVTIRDFLQRFSPAVLRLFVLSRHYRSPIDYNESYLQEQERKIEDLTKFAAKLEFAQKHAKTKNTDRKKNQEAIAALGETHIRFFDALEDDFNTPEAIASVFELIRATNLSLWSLSPATLKKIRTTILQFFKIFGLTFEFPDIPEHIAALAAERDHLRKKKEFTGADKIRKQAHSLGYVIEDSPAGPFIWPEAYRAPLLPVDEREG